MPRGQTQRVCNVCGHHWWSTQFRPSQCPSRYCTSCRWDTPFPELEGDRAHFKVKLDRAVAEYQALVQKHVLAECAKAFTEPEPAPESPEEKKISDSA
jgi:hypothetical protein